MEFESPGHFFQAVADAAYRFDNQPNLKWQAVAGLGETIPSEGAFLVPAEYAADLLEKTYATGSILSRCNRLPMSKKELVVPTIDETSRANGSRFGGIAMNWTAEGEEIVASKPKYASRGLGVRKLAGLCYVTEELLQDAPALNAILSRLFSLEAGFQIEDAIVNGSGAGRLLGILNSGAVIEVAKESGQAAATVVAGNVVNMFSRLWSGGQNRAVWLVNQNIFPQLLGLTWSSGTGVVPLFSYGPDGTPLLIGRPVLMVEYCSTLGTVGDIILCDLGEFLLGDRTDGVIRPLGLAFTTDSAVGGVDDVFGLEGRDIVFGGAEGDVLNAGATDVSDDLIVGDSGRARFEDDVLVEISTVDPTIGGGDTITAGRGSNKLEYLEPAPSDAEDAVHGEVPDGVLEAIISHLAENTEADPAGIEVLHAEAVTWNDGSLGCAAPGQIYTQATVPGYRVVLGHDGQQFDYRATERGFFLLCSQPTLAAPGAGDDPPVE